MAICNECKKEYKGGKIESVFASGNFICKPCAKKIMQKSKSTPGPWKIQRDFRYDQDAFSIEKRGNGLRSIIALTNDNWLCEEHGDLMQNTKLIAALPDLLDFVIQYLYSEHNVCDPGHDAAPYTSDELKLMAIEVIEKAT